MALSRVKVWIAEVLTFADQNAEFDNILNNALSLISPLTGSLDAGGFDITALDELQFNNAAADATAIGRLRRNTASLTWHDGAAARNLITTPPTGGADAGLLYFLAANVRAQSLAAATNGQLPIGNTGTFPNNATLTAGAGIGITNGAGSITVAHAPGSISWVNCNYAGVINDSYNVTSVTDDGIGETTITWATDFAAAAYAATAMTRTADDANPRFAMVNTLTAGATKVITYDTGSLKSDAQALMVIAIGDL